MTINELFNCIRDYVTCCDHDCGECFAFRTIKSDNNEHHNVCQLLNTLDFGVLVNEEDEN